MEVALIILFFSALTWIDFFGGMASRTKRESGFYLVCIVVSLVVLLVYGVV